MSGLNIQKKVTKYVWEYGHETRYALWLCNTHVWAFENNPRLASHISSL